MARTFFLVMEGSVYTKGMCAFRKHKDGNYGT